MNNDNLSRFSKKVVQYFWDPLPKNEDMSPIWCLGRAYESKYQEPKPVSVPGTSPSASSESAISQADSAVVTEEQPKKEREERQEPQPDASESEEEALGWPPAFLDDQESRIWLTYRSNFPPIPKSQDPAANSAMTFATRLKQLGNQGGFTSDAGWGCMIRSGQSLLANALAVHRLGRDWRKGEKEEERKELLALFADHPDAPFSIHRFVEHGAQACGKHPGEWFGPSATARCIQALAQSHTRAGLRVYVRPDDSDVYRDSLLQAATDSSGTFQPTLILLGIRLGIDRITPVYHAALQAALELPQSVGIAGGRPSAAHYFFGHQGDSFFYLDPHSTRPHLPVHADAADVASCHTRRLRRLGVREMDPSMLMGFYVRSERDFEDWCKAVGGVEGKAIVHVHEAEPSYQGAHGEREGAVDEVETWDETGDEGEGM